METQIRHRNNMYIHSNLLHGHLYSFHKDSGGGISMIIDDPTSAQQHDLTSNFSRFEFSLPPIRRRLRYMLTLPRLALS